MFVCVCWFGSSGHPHHARRQLVFMTHDIGLLSYLARVSVCVCVCVCVSCTTSQIVNGNAQLYFMFKAQKF